MNHIAQNTTLSYFKIKPPEFSNFKLRKSIELFEARPLPLICKKNTHYAALKKPISGFKDGLLFVHKLCTSKSKSSSINSSKLSSKAVSPIPKLPQYKSISTGKYRMPARSKTPCMNISELIIQKPVEEKTQMPQRPKITIKRTNKRKEDKESCEDESIQLEEIKAWNRDFNG